MDQLSVKSETQPLIQWDKLPHDDNQRVLTNRMGFNPKDIIDVTDNNSDAIMTIIGVHIPAISKQLYSKDKKPAKSMNDLKSRRLSQSKKDQLAEDLALSESDDDLEEEKPASQTFVKSEQPKWSSSAQHLQQHSKSQKSTATTYIPSQPPISSRLPSSSITAALGTSSNSASSNALRTSSLQIGRASCRERV